jgi:hypothetical protein
LEPGQCAGLRRWWGSNEFTGTTMQKLTTGIATHVAAALFVELLFRAFAG